MCERDSNAIRLPSYFFQFDSSIVIFDLILFIYILSFMEFQFDYREHPLSYSAIRRLPMTLVAQKDNLDNGFKSGKVNSEFQFHIHVC